MLPAIAPGDWLLVDPLVRRWPRRGSVVVFREPDGDELAIKRVEARPGDTIPFARGFLTLGGDEAWLTSDADTAVTSSTGFGPPRDSRHYGPVPMELLVGRVWWRYAPLRRFGRVGGRERAATAEIESGTRSTHTLLGVAGAPPRSDPGRRLRGKR
jgi:signal peptidase I